MLRRARRFPKARGGMAAVEFAFVAPLLITMFYGAIELVEAVDCKTRVTDIAATTSDLVAQSTVVSTTDVNNIFGAANAIMFPYSATGMQIVISSLVDNGAGGARVAWSNAQNATPRTVGSTVAVPTGLIVSGSGGSIILAEITYTYHSPTTRFLHSAVTMRDSFYSKPRRSVVVTHT
jgi:Flp pilus assembly protein TadG